MRRAEIIERLEKAEGADRELDRAIMACFYTLEKRHIGGFCWDDGPDDMCCPDAKHIDTVWVDPATDSWISTAPLCFSSSLDAAIALVERTLPGWSWGIRDFGDYLSEAVVVEYGAPFSEDSGRPYRGETPACALLVCLFRALEAKEAPHG